jgi:hypothetical protein
MSAKLFMFCTFVFILGTIISGIWSGGWLQTGDITTMNSMMSFNATYAAGTGGMTILSQASRFITVGLPTIFTWNYPFLEGAAGIIKWIFLYPITIGMIWGVAQVFAPALTGIFGNLRNLLGL